jgi:hypothetical protein
VKWEFASCLVLRPKYFDRTFPSVFNHENEFCLVKMIAFFKLNLNAKKFTVGFRLCSF